MLRPCSAGSTDFACSNTRSSCLKFHPPTKEPSYRSRIPLWADPERDRIQGHHRKHYRGQDPPFAVSRTTALAMHAPSFLERDGRSRRLVSMKLSRLAVLVRSSILADDTLPHHAQPVLYTIQAAETRRRRFCPRRRGQQEPLDCQR